MALVRRKAYLIDAGYTVRNGKTYVTLILKGKKTVKRYYQSDPYFLVEAPADKKDLLMSIRARDKRGFEVSPLRVEETERKVGLGRRPMLKLFCREPSHVPIIQPNVPFPSHEYNIPFARRFMFDMGLIPLGVIAFERQGKEIKKILSINGGEPKLASMSFDIETYNAAGTPREEKDPAIMISYNGVKKGVITYKDSAQKFVERVQDEKAMLERFSQIVQEEDPDILVGYNSSQFDLPYLIARANASRAKFRIGRFGSQIKPVTKGMIKGMRIQGRAHVDLYPMMKFFGVIGIIKAQRYTLDAVSEDVLGSKKVKMKKEDIWQLWDRGDIDHLCEYSMVDAELTYALGERFIPIEAELSSVAKMPFFDTTLSTSGQLVENLLMFHAAGKGMLIPGKPGGDSIGERLAAPIQGAFVKLPEPGIYENVAVLDFRGLYPSIIVSYNIDPGTLLNAQAPKHETSEYFTSPTGAMFSRKEVGLIPFVLDYLIDLRMVLKRTLKTLDKSSDEHVRISARSQALKILANSFYGYMGYARSRWYSRPCAESVTAWGRKHIMETIDAAEKSGFQVLYADTDSVFLLYKDKKAVTDFMASVNSSLPQKMELELEGFFPRGVFVSKKGGEERGAKKKYALLGEDGRIKIRGFELVRRDWSRIARDTQLKVLEAILKDGSKEKAAAIIRDVVTRLQAGKVPLEVSSDKHPAQQGPGELCDIQPRALSSEEAGPGRHTGRARDHDLIRYHEGRERVEEHIGEGHASRAGEGLRRRLLHQQPGHAGCHEDNEGARIRRIQHEVRREAEEPGQFLLNTPHGEMI